MSKFWNFLSKFTAFCLSTVFLFILIGLIAIFLGEKFVSTDNISTIIKNVDLKEVKLGDVDNKDNKETAFDYVYSYTSKLGLTEQETEQLLKKEEVNSIIAKYFGDISNFYLYGEDVPTYTKEEIMLDITKINNLLPAENQINLTDKGVEEATEEINNLSETLTTKQVQTSSETSFITFDQTYIKNAKIYMLISLVVIFCLIALVRFKLYSPLGWCGIPMVSVGCLYMLFSLTRYTVAALKDSFGKYEYIVSFLSKNMFNKSLIYGLIVFILGLIMTIAYNLIKDKRDYKDDQLDDNKEEEELAKL
jgi:hypothetical protein